MSLMSPQILSPRHSNSPSFKFYRNMNESGVKKIQFDNGAKQITSSIERISPKDIKKFLAEKLQD